MTEIKYSDDDHHKDVAVLHSMGYAQELERRMSAFSNFAVSFSIICILSGGINSLGQATSGAGGGTSTATRSDNGSPLSITPSTRPRSTRITSGRSRCCRSG